MIVITTEINSQVLWVPGKRLNILNVLLRLTSQFNNFATDIPNWSNNILVRRCIFLRSVWAFSPYIHVSIIAQEQNHNNLTTNTFDSKMNVMLHGL